MGLLNATANVLSDAANALSQPSGNQQVGGFATTAIPSADGNGLPSSKVPSQQLGVATRNIVHWYVPEVGIVNMYINPQSIDYNLKKLITPERTKGGYNIQYWGEELTTLVIQGHTGSSGVNGLNVLYEVYRAEQLLFDPIALTMAADNSITGLNDLVDSALGNIGGLAASVASATTGILGLNPASQNILPRNIPSLSSMALGIEMYWSNWVYRGFFSSFSFNESADKVGLFTYNIGFTVTQRRGYRTNAQAWQHSAIDGPSNWETNPLSISDLA